MKNEQAAFLKGRVIYHTKDIAVVNKQIGEICETTVKDKSLSLISNLRGELEECFGCAAPDVQAVHRIDQPVSGCVLLARTPEVCAALSAEFSSGRTRKRYLAVTEKPASPLTADSGVMEHFIRFDSKHHKAYTFPFAEKPPADGVWKKAALEWKLAGEGDKYLFLIIHPLTGRTHQIRAQLSASGMPIKGDLKYGARRSDPKGGIRLHASRIQFYLPGTGDVCTVTAPILDPDNLWNAFPLQDD